MIDFGPEICHDLEAAEQREWLVTNGVGGFACGTIAGTLTRRYHGLLVAALKPPLGRTLLVTKIDDIAEYGGQSYELGTNRWRDGAVAPRGHQLIQRFRLEGTTPVWTFACGDALLEKSVIMVQGENTTRVRYQLIRGAQPLQLILKVLVNYRDFHSVTRAGDWRMDVQPCEHGVRVIAYPGALPIYLLSAEARAEPAHIWYRNFDLAVERERGLEDWEDHLLAAIFTAELSVGDSIVLSVGPTVHSPVEISNFKVEISGPAQVSVLPPAWSDAPGRPTRASALPAAPDWVRQLVLSAHQFIVKRTLPENPEAHTVIAGYPWFGNWGRDTMIALPGLALACGRAEIAREILTAFGHYVSDGMIPNFFPEGGSQPEYNTVDAALWFIEAARHYYATTKDLGTIETLFPALNEIIRGYVRGTRFQIHLDRTDGLIYAGEQGVALTWMDARVNGMPVTPRTGKPVEVNALWFNALLAMARFARLLKKSSVYFESMAKRAHEGFQRFWNSDLDYCFDVLDAPGSNDPSLRPNQIFAVSLAGGLLPHPQMRAVVDICEKHLLTPRGLRTLGPHDARYRGRYTGAPDQRDAAYHQGTVWAWLLGPFVLAHFRVYGDRARARAFLEPMEHAMMESGLGTLGEIYDGDPPFRARGCIAQAWSVAEVLRVWSAEPALERRD